VTSADVFHWSVVAPLLFLSDTSHFFVPRKYFPSAFLPALEVFRATAPFFELFPNIAAAEHRFSVLSLGLTFASLT